MTDITPPPKLVQQWMSEFYGSPTVPGELTLHIATRAAQWGYLVHEKALLDAMHATEPFIVEPDDSDE